MDDFWQSIGSFASGSIERVSEGVGQFADSYLDFELTKIAEKRASTTEARLAEPVKGTTTTGQPIVVQSSATAGISQNTMLLVGGGLAAALLLAYVLKK